MDETTQQIVFGLAAPLVFAAAMLWPGSGGPRDRRDRFAWRIPIALGAPVTLAFLALYGRPTEQWQSVVYVPVAGALVGVVASVTPRIAWWRVGLHVVLAALVTAAIWPVIAREPIGLKLLPGLGMLALTAVIDPLAARRPGASVPTALVIVAGTTAAVVMISGFMKLTIPSVALTIALLVFAALAPWRPRLSLAAGGAMAVAPMLVAPPLVAWLYMASGGGDLPAASFVLPGASLGLLWLGETPVVRNRSPRVALPIRLLLVAAACAVSIALALRGGGEVEAEDPLEQMYRDMMGRRTTAVDHA